MLWLKCLFSNTDSLSDANQHFLLTMREENKGIVAVKNVEHVLSLLLNKRERIAIFIPDWGDYERQQYRSLIKRLNKNE